MTAAQLKKREVKAVKVFDLERHRQGMGCPVGKRQNLVMFTFNEKCVPKLFIVLPDAQSILIEPVAY